MVRYRCPMCPVVPYITGDGVGAEVTPSMQSRCERGCSESIRQCKRQIEWKEEVLAGERTFPGDKLLAAG